MSCHPEMLAVECKNFMRLPLAEVAEVLSEGLRSNFKEVVVGVVDCPDLTKEPFNLVQPGLGGSARLIEVGGPPYLLPLVDKAKVYDLKNIVQLSGLSDAFVVGAGAGPWPYIGKNCELIVNALIGKSGGENGTHIAVLDSEEKEYKVQALPQDENRFCLLANLFCSLGLPGKVIKVHCKNRIGEDDFVASIRKTLFNRYKETPVGMGGCFLFGSGEAKIHIMPSFSTEPLDSDDKLNNWLKFFSMSSPLVAVGTLVSSDIPGLDLRVQHFHCLSDHNQGGHFHYDTTPSQAEYLGYFNLAECIYRIDKPTNTHLIGRD